MFLSTKSDTDNKTIKTKTSNHLDSSSKMLDAKN
jgi:hypothetical protein